VITWRQWKGKAARERPREHSMRDGGLSIGSSYAPAGGGRVSLTLHEDKESSARLTLAMNVAEAQNVIARLSRAVLSAQLGEAWERGEEAGLDCYEAGDRVVVRSGSYEYAFGTVKGKREGVSLHVLIDEPLKSLAVYASGEIRKLA